MIANRVAWKIFDAILVGADTVWGLERFYGGHHYWAAFFFTAAAYTLTDALRRT